MERVHPTPDPSRRRAEIFGESGELLKTIYDVSELADSNKVMRQAIKLKAVRVEWYIPIREKMYRLSYRQHEGITWRCYVLKHEPLTNQPQP